MRVDIQQYKKTNIVLLSGVPVSFKYNKKPLDHNTTVLIHSKIIRPFVLKQKEFKLDGVDFEDGDNLTVEGKDWSIFRDEYLLLDAATSPQFFIVLLRWLIEQQPKYLPLLKKYPIVYRASGLIWLVHDYLHALYDVDTEEYTLNSISDSVEAVRWTQASTLTYRYLEGGVNISVIEHIVQQFNYREGSKVTLSHANGGIIKI